MNACAYVCYVQQCVCFVDDTCVTATIRMLRRRYVWYVDDTCVMSTIRELSRQYVSYGDNTGAQMFFPAYGDS